MDGVCVNTLFRTTGGVKGFRCVGCWKAYGDPCEAEKTFARFKRCTAIYRRESENGIPLERLIVDRRCRAVYN